MKLIAAAAAAGLILGAAVPAAAAYLTPETTPDTFRVLPPPPGVGSGVLGDDLKAFKATRKLKGSPRWSLAVNDVQASGDAALRDFACALGITATPAQAPALMKLLFGMGGDMRAVIDPPKDRIGRDRPYIGRKDEICVPRSEQLDGSKSYPSGHATAGWTWALILAELAPDRATDILLRGRAYGESRVVCGVHFPTDVAAGRLNASALVAALHGSAEFRADMDKARAELAALRQSAPAPDAGQCKTEQDLIARRPW
jgi:acid phosphatase (class A)